MSSPLEGQQLQFPEVATWIGQLLTGEVSRAQSDDITVEWMNTEVDRGVVRGAFKVALGFEFLDHVACVKVNCFIWIYQKVRLA